MKSIIYPESYYQWQRECFICHSLNPEEHHVFHGNGQRKLSEKHGMKVDLCHRHHRGNNKECRGVHFDRELDIYFKRMFQAKFEETHTRSEFVGIFGKNYL